MHDGAGVWDFCLLLEIIRWKNGAARLVRWREYEYELVAVRWPSGRWDFFKMAVLGGRRALQRRET